MGSILIAMPRTDDAERIASHIKESDIWEPVRICRRGADVLFEARNGEVDIVICTRRLPDMGYVELSDYLPSSVKMLLLTSDAGLLPFSSNITKLMMPFKPRDLIATAKMLLPGNGFSIRKGKIPRSEEEQKLIDRAKGILMNNNEMSEPEAFRYIQKSSMDYGRTLVETAQMIITLNEEY